MFHYNSRPFDIFDQLCGYASANAYQLGRSFEAWSPTLLGTMWRNQYWLEETSRFGSPIKQGCTMDVKHERRTSQASARRCQRLVPSWLPGRRAS